MKKPWPTKEAMEQVYALNLWGGSTSDFYSGEGSHLPEIIQPYLKAVIFFLSSFEKPITVLDVGCGDFNIGKQLVKYTKSYIGVDIVPALILHNTNHFIIENLEFYCLDIVKDALPNAQCLLIRQVLQHLSNAEIIALVAKLEEYKYIILTEHLPNGTFIANVDIISGQGIRLKKKSGVQIVAAPFNLKIKEEKKLTSYDLGHGKGIVVTTLYTLF